jgi:hypothetical protein
MEMSSFVLMWRYRDLISYLLASPSELRGWAVAGEWGFEEPI